jgi:hypothetical protein
MVNTYANIIVFVLTTMAYFLAFKPKLTVDILSNPTEYAKYNKNVYFRLAIYFLFVILLQFGINVSVIASKCGGSLKENIAVAGFMTFLPWSLIFGIVMTILIIFPGFKSAFSDVIGYFMVAGSANKVLTKLLVDTKIDQKINNTFGVGGEENVGTTTNTNIPVEQNPSPLITNSPLNNEQQGGEANKKAYQDVAEAIIKLCGNMSILVNQIVPENFLQYWKILKPLMKPKYQKENAETHQIKQELLGVVSTRDNIGEGFWYLYTGVLLTSIIQYYITSRPCVKDMKAIQSDYQQFLDNEAAAKAKQDSIQNSYTITQ